MANYRLHVRLIISILAIFCGLCPALAKRGDFDRSSLAAKTTAGAFDDIASHELSKLTSKGAKDWVKGVSDAVPAKDDLLRLQEIARRAVEAGKQSTTNPVQSQRLQKIQEALKNLEGGN